MIVLDLSILNQKGTPMFNSDTFANRPAFGIVGRIFISTDTKEFFRDTGTSWELIGGPGSGTITGSGTAGTLPIWTSSSALGDSSLLEGSTKITTIKDIQADGYYLTGMTGGSGALYWTSDRVTLANYNVGGIVHIEVNGGTASTIFGTDLSLTNYGYIAATPTLTAANNASSLASYGINTLSYAAGFSSNNIGALYGGMAGFNLQTFAGSATFAQANVASGSASINSIDFSSAGSTITMTQSSGIRVMSGSQSQLQYQGTNSGTITHAAISQNLGFYRPSGASGTLTITNAYSHLINALDDYGAGFTFTNRWGIYQAGSSDTNYFAGKILTGTNVNTGDQLQITGNTYIDGNLGIGTNQYNPQVRLRVRSGFSSYASDLATSVSLATIQIATHATDSTITTFSGVTSGNGIIQRSNGSGTTTYALLLNPFGGNIGIGNINPTSKLTIGDLSNVSGTLNDIFITGDKVNAQGYFSRLIFSNSTQAGGSTASIQAERGPSSNFETQLTFYTNTSSSAGSGVEAMRITGGQNLLINTTADGDSKLLVVNSNSAYAAYFKANTLYAGLYRIQRLFANNNIVMDITSDNGSNISFSNNQVGAINFGTSGIDRVQLASNGNLLIGSTTNPGQKLYLNGSFRIDGQTSGSAGVHAGQHLIINCDGTTYKIALLNP